MPPPPAAHPQRPGSETGHSVRRWNNRNPTQTAEAAVAAIAATACRNPAPGRSRRPARARRPGQQGRHRAPHQHHPAPIARHHQRQQPETKCQQRKRQIMARRIRTTPGQRNRARRWRTPARPAQSRIPPWDIRCAPTPPKRKAQRRSGSRPWLPRPRRRFLMRWQPSQNIMSPPPAWPEAPVCHGPINRAADTPVVATSQIPAVPSRRAPNAHQGKAHCAGKVMGQTLCRVQHRKVAHQAGRSHLVQLRRPTVHTDWSPSPQPWPRHCAGVPPPNRSPPSPQQHPSAPDPGRRAPLSAHRNTARTSMCLCPP